MFKKLATTAAICAALLSNSAQANLITSDVAISTTNTVQYVYFNVTTAGGFDIRALGSDSLSPASTWNKDPEIYLFKNTLSTANYLYSDDDSGNGLDSLINNVQLSIGQYILAISEFNFSLAEAIAGNNASGNGVDDPGLIRIQIEGVSYDVTTGNGRNRTTTTINAGVAAFNTTNNVPEPASLALLGLGLACAGAIRRRKA